MTELLFVYGTLRPGSHHPMARRLSRVAALLGRARLRGRLYRLGRYPGAMRGSNGVVAGELLRLRGSMVLRRLDRYEGADYRRRRTPVTAHGRIRMAWCYFFRGRAAGLRRIRSGDWSTEHQDRHQRYQKDPDEGQNIMPPHGSVPLI